MRTHTDSVLKGIKESDKMSGYLVCYRCFSENIKFVRENDKTLVYKCEECGNVFVKKKEGSKQWQDYKVK